MKTIILSDAELKSLNIMIEYLSDSEKRHYEESSKDGKIDHIYKHTRVVRRALKTSTR